MKRLPIGKVIYSMRKEKGATQEDLAQSVGVSVPAVSRWESSQAYPDITLLPSIARYFNTTIDHLLDYDLELGEDAALDLVEECGRLFETEGVGAAVALCERYLYQYPQNLFLKFRLGALYFACLEQAADAGEMEELAYKAIRLLKLAATSDTDHIAYNANYLLSALYSLVGRGDLSEEILAKIPKNPINPEDMLVPLYIRQQRYDEAKKLLQTNMLKRLRHVGGALVSYAAICGGEGGDEGGGELEEALLRLNEGLLDMFRLDPGSRVAGLLELACCCARRRQAGQVLRYMEKLAECLQEMSQADGGEYYLTNPLFSHVEPAAAASRSLDYYRRLLLKSLEQGEEFDFLRQERAFAQALERLRAIWSR
ncbi:MAG: helix-turn-helix domain-containing protein [Peptococcaceae bacterium]|nr:helix-turn-helix domain-containing protein [Peptococcaceae bacterium]